ncbi:MAG TPA: hypothetical protein PJ994_00760 [Tepidiformaceae bacterium]|nr:hypothetical protein [Tepidiformaceae bacterium]HMO94983.1 hypothetical protein [Tepidiformaceae bacterium]
MHTQLHRRRTLLAAIALVALTGGALFAACGDDDDDDNGHSGSNAQNAEVLNAILFLSGAGLHGIDDSINDEGVVPANARLVAQRAEAVTRITNWPDDIKPQAAALADIFKEMAAALEGDSPDVAAAGAAAKRAHDAEHDFSNLVWDHLFHEAGVESSGGGH